MRSLLKMIFWLVVLGIIVLLAIIFVPAQRTPLTVSVPQGDAALAERGQYLAVLADCAACHGAGVQAFAGGAPIASPFGKIYASNITPSKQYGIGNYSLDDFSAALRDGLRPGGGHLYPAMPYENYRFLTDEDIVALYAYFMQKVQPVERPVQQTSLVFPFNQRWGIRLWNWFALGRETGFSLRYQDSELNRGAYIVETLAHCGACHTPRDILFRQKGLNPSNLNFLTGAAIDGWHAPDLRSSASPMGEWTDDDLKFYLLTGRNRFTAAAGPMNEAIEHSLQYMNQADVNAVIAYLMYIKQAGAPALPVREAKLTTDMLTEAKPDMALGARLYLDNCAACHFVDGQGAAEIFPRLDGSSIVNAKEAGGLIRVILSGSRLPSTRLRPEDLAMPGFGWRLDNGEVAELVNFLRSGWTNNAAPINSADVAKIRARSDIE